MGFTYQYEVLDYGTERTLTVYLDGMEIGSCDPFWQSGVPVNPATRKRRLERAARQIIDDFKQRQSVSAGGAM